MFWVLLSIVSFLLAKVEIQIEGKYGYAKRLPVTWRTTNKWTLLFFTGTSYHIYMGLFILAIVQIPFAVGLAWSLKSEYLILSFITLMTVLEDFLWYALNPAIDDETGKRMYGIRNFRKGVIPDDKRQWFLFLPSWYWWYLPIGLSLYYLGVQ